MKKIGKLREGVENIDELCTLHMTAGDLWKSSERVALRLDKSDFNSVTHWWRLTTIPDYDISPKVWEELSLFLSNCHDVVFKNFFLKLNTTKITLGEFLSMLGENNSTGEEIFAFFYNIMPALSGYSNKKVDAATNNIRKKLKNDPNANLIEIGKYYNMAQNNNGNNFRTYEQWLDFFRLT